MNKSIYRRMKRFHIYIVALLAIVGVMTSCSKSETKSLDVPSRSILVAMPGDVGTTSFDSSNITSLKPTSIPEGWTLVNIDMYNATITVKAPESFDNEEVESGTLSLTGYTPTGNTKSVDVYLAIVPEKVVFEEVANCYVACKPKTRYMFDPMCGGGDGSVELATAEVKLVWQTAKNLVKYLDMRDVTGDGKVEAMFYVSSETDDKGNELDSVVAGNAVIGAYDADGKLIWTWHIWVTNNDPMAAENVVAINGVEMMNHNLGADTNSEGAADKDAIGGSYGVYYQWGRKEPLPGPQSWNFSLNYDALLYAYNELFELTLGYVESSEGGSLEWANENPLNVVKGSPENDYDWLNNGHDDALWSAASKSVNDPCPAGWRLPDIALFENLTILASDDAMAWEEAQRMYGWWLEDTTTNETYFFSAAGRRNYLDGRLDNMNVNAELPVPWSGYYWSATTDGNFAKALYFNLNTETRTWNGIETNRTMQRANAFPVRCVRE